LGLTLPPKQVIPSTSAGARPQSSRAFRTASAASAVGVRPEDRLYPVRPIPTTLALLNGLDLPLVNRASLPWFA